MEIGEADEADAWYGYGGRMHVLAYFQIGPYSWNSILGNAFEPTCIPARGAS